jgi:hypothetical protein
MHTHLCLHACVPACSIDCLPAFVRPRACVSGSALMLLPPPFDMKMLLLLLLPPPPPPPPLLLLLDMLDMLLLRTRVHACGRALAA